MTRDQVFRIIKEVKKGYLQTHSDDSNGVVRIEYVVPFVDGDFGLSVWAFFETDELLSNAKASGSTDAFQAEYDGALENAGYDPAWLSRVTYVFDSIENVDTNYEGSFFYRLR